jgi:cysteine desulfurase / selenocysteine lyase
MSVTIALGDRSPYPHLEAEAYLAYAATAPVSVAVKAAVNAVLDSYATRGNVALFEWLPQRERLRQKLGQLIGADASDIALTSGTSRGIGDLALSMPWRTGERVVLFDGEFPANVSPWQRAAELFGLEIELVPLAHAVEEPDSFLKPLVRLLERGVRLVSVSAVQFQTGLCMPLATIAELCRKFGAELCVDAIQACGAVPLDVRAQGIDYLVCGAHKWLLGPEGVGFVYARRECARLLRPRTAGWLSHVDGVSFLFEGPGHLRYDRPLKDSLQVLEGGSSSTLGFAALEAGLDPLLELTPAAIWAHLQRYHDALEPAVVARGFRSRRATDAAFRSGILSFEPPQGVSAAALVAELRSKGVFASMPDGLLRFSPHFPNALTETARVVSALDHALSRAR